MYTVEIWYRHANYAHIKTGGWSEPNTLMYTLKLVLDQRRQRNDKTYPLVIRIRNKGKYIDLPTGVSSSPQNFDEAKQVIKFSKEVNNNVTKLKTQYQTKVIELVSNNDTEPSLTEIKAYLLKKPTQELTLKEFWSKEIESLIKSGRAGGAITYKDTLRAISQVLDVNKPLHAYTYSDVVEAQVSFLAKGVKINSIGVYFRTFRAICNKAILQELVPMSWYPFKKYKIKKEKTTPRALTLAQTRQYFSLNIPNDHPLYKSWCIGKLIFMLRGINLKDLLVLRPTDITNGRVIYRRSKTKKLYSIELLPETRAILEELYKGGDTLLGVLDGKLSALKVDMEAVEDYRQVRKVVNAHLKRLGKLSEIDMSITTYVFRYTYANIAKQLGYSKDMIAEALGHEYGNTVTGIYLEMFDNEVLDKMNATIIDAVVKRVVV